nr:MAG TPA: hypothetical protein [Caudoviricetes sp.]
MASFRALLPICTSPRYGVGILFPLLIIIEH